MTTENVTAPTGGRLRRVLEWMGLTRPRQDPSPSPAPVPPQQEEPVAEDPAPAGAAPTVTAEATRNQVREQDLLTVTLANMAMRDLTMVESLLDIVEQLEGETEDPTLLEQLFRIDNLATRMRRNGENLLVLAGQDTGDPSMEPVPMLDVARAAISEITDYERIQVGHLPEKALAGAVVDDVSHLLAELLDNATAKSPDHAQVVVSAQPMSGERLLITVEDEGIGIPKPQIDQLNARLSGTPVLDDQVVRHMGLYVVSRIAHRHGLEVQLEPRAFRGTSAHVVIPARLLSDSVAPAAPADPPAQPEARPAPKASAPRTEKAPTTRSAPSTVPSSQPSRPSSSPASPTAESSADGSAASVTSAGLPRRSANRSNSPMQAFESPDDEGREEPQDAESKAERIRSDLDGFLSGEREATSDDD
ncbi:sensor histidine kinase [Salinactinospora qingdaonensis]|uniref:histidine kinase n=1 Tax=Salinactinospora qingdaonensis TaxID=702744 RepID=A0ABP7EZD2_9ACTN